MLAERTPCGFQFTCVVAGSPLRIELTLHEDGTESVAVCSQEPPMRLPPEPLPRGTIQRWMGPQQWTDFERLRNKGFSKMLLDAPGVA